MFNVVASWIQTFLIELIFSCGTHVYRLDVNNLALMWWHLEKDSNEMASCWIGKVPDGGGRNLTFH